MIALGHRLKPLRFAQRSGRKHAASSGRWIYDGSRSAFGHRASRCPHRMKDGAPFAIGHLLEHWPSGGRGARHVHDHHDAVQHMLAPFHDGMPVIVVGRIGSLARRGERGPRDLFAPYSADAMSSIPVPSVNNVRNDDAKLIVHVEEGEFGRRALPTATDFAGTGLAVLSHPAPRRQCAT